MMNILFLCTANLHRSRTAEDYFRLVNSKHEFLSAGLSEKYCKQHGTRLCSVEMLDWADKVFVMEAMHVERITQHTEERFLDKIENLHVDDIYQYMQAELLEKLKSSKQLQFINQ
ncbi:MAG: phosphotyrosine protein phosphatase [Colwellia sp.]|nr:phosphotyrosine protein phosphatase [Colwellia sp.]